MANPRYNQPKRQSGREKKLSELASLLQMSNASQAPMIEQQQLQQREQASRQNTMMQFMQMMNEQQMQQQRAQQGQAQLGLQERELQQRGQVATSNRDMENWQATDASQRAWQALQQQQLELKQREQEATGRQQGVDLGILGSLAERGDAAALKALGMRIPEYGQAHAAGLAEAEAKRAAAMPDALRAVAGGAQQAKAPTNPNDAWWNLIPSLTAQDAQQMQAPTAQAQKVSYHQNYDRHGNPTNLIEQNEEPLKPAWEWLMQQLSKTGGYR